MNPNYREILKQIMDFKQEGTRVLISGLLVKLIIGLFFAWPILQSYHEILIGYKDLNHQYFIYISYALMIFIMNLFIPHTDFFLKKLGPQALICIFVCLIGMSFMLMAIFDQHWIIHLLLQLFVIAPSVGILYSTPFLTTWRYFVKQKQHLNSIFQIFIGLGAFFALLIFESNQADQLELYFDNDQYFCGECFNLQTRRSLRGLTIWAFILGITAALLVKQPDGDIADSVVDYDLLAFAHLDLKQQQHSQNSLNENDQSFDQPITFTQSLSTKPFQIMSILVVSSSLLPYLIFCQYSCIEIDSSHLYSIQFINFKIFQKVQKKQLKSTLSENPISFRCILCTIMYYLLNFYFVVWTYEISLQLFYFRLAIQNCNKKVRLNKYAPNSHICCFTLVGQYYFNQHYVFCLYSVFSHFVLCDQYNVLTIFHFTSIPKIFGSMASQGVFSFMLAIMGLSAIISNSISYFFPEGSTKMMLFYFSIKVFLGQMFVYRVSK